MIAGSTTYISFEHSKQFTKLILDYAQQQPQLDAFYNLPPKVESFVEMMKQKNFDDSFRPILVQELYDQYQASGITLKKKDFTTQQLELLKESSTFTVTTGHQLCLLTGPLYFIHKILSTIKWCDELKKSYPQHHFIPVFWMASEDHDFAEVNHLYTSEGKISWNIHSNDQPVGRLELKQFEDFAKQVMQLATNDFAQKQLEELLSFYNGSETLSVATRKLVHYLFASYGLVIIDADSKILKQKFIPHIKKDITENSNYKALSNCNIELKKLGYKSQVNGREINFFYLSDKGRKLINKNKEIYTVEETTIAWNESEILAEIDQSPEKFSPNVVLRPLYQEIILPNLSYIGGPGEIAYWLQLKPVFANNEVTFPILTLRAFIILFKIQHEHQLEKMGLSIDDLFTPRVELERKLVSLIPDGGQFEQAQNLENLFQHIIDISNRTDNKISSELIALKISTRNALERLLKQLDKKQRAKIERFSQQINQIQNVYFPSNLPQERYFNILEWGKTQSIPQLIETIHRSMNSTQTAIQAIEVH